MLDLTNHRYGRLTVDAFKERIRSGGRRGTYWYCTCSCGATGVVVSTKQLRCRTRPTRSCGCLMREIAVEHAHQQHKHHESDAAANTAEYRCWKTIKSRCYNRHYKQFKDYGGRGIRVCDRWLNSYASFLADMGRKPSPTHSIGRKDNDGDYTHENCYWATDEEQRRNKRTKYLTSGMGRA